MLHDGVMRRSDEACKERMSMGMSRGVWRAMVSGLCCVGKGWMGVGVRVWWWKRQQVGVRQPLLDLGN